MILPDERAVCACDVRGGGPGTRETDALAPENLVEAVDAVVLSGGSVYGLAAADGVTAWLGARGRGFGLVAPPGVPPLAGRAGRDPLSTWPTAATRPGAWSRPIARWAWPPSSAAGADFALGTAGAGYGAMAGALKGGIGSASIVTADGITVGALVAVNSFGSVVAPGGRTFWAAPYEIGRRVRRPGPGGPGRARRTTGASPRAPARSRAPTPPSPASPPTRR